jgi:Tfp pilus assembly protein PilF
VLNNVGVVRPCGDLAAAVSFRDVLRLEPFFHRAWHNLGVVLGAKGDRNGAVAAFRRAAELQPSDASAIYNLTILAREMGSDRANERAGYERALKVDPDLTEAHLSLGTLLADRRRRRRSGTSRAPAATEALPRARVRRRLTGHRQAQDWLVARPRGRYTHAARGAVPAGAATPR